MSRLNMRIDEELKEAASQLYQSLGMDLTTAVTIFLKQSVREGGLPFRPSLKGDDGAPVNKEELPIPVKAEAYAGILRVRFDNDVVRYVKIAADDSAKIRLNPLDNLPQEVSIDDQGTIVLPDGQRITAKEAWKQGKLSMNIRINPFV
ncbi:type II toxin-antitoxin system RelB/DinJ family antitoxin [Enterococcus asini]|uniref:type II toxin-antitoxin system RelB/DinJ family antitoxin n=1 Tax=Enterococcus asini TaxID=57732 RepID=UPI0015F6A0B5|nr:type II toxin-antitoxin system RelB/DinJ family antitoxin [Enterococcus asini]